MGSSVSHGGSGIFTLLLLGGLGYAALSVQGDKFFVEPEMGVHEAPVSGRGCVNFSDQMRVERLQDQAAVAALLGPLQAIGVCGSYKMGETLVVEKKAHYPDALVDEAMHGMICVRPYGRRRCFWAMTGNVFPSLRKATPD